MGRSLPLALALALGLATACRPGARPTTAPGATKAEPAAAPLWFADASERGVPSGWIEEDEALSNAIAGQRVSSLVVGWSWPNDAAMISKTYACQFDWKDGDRVALEAALAKAGFVLERTPGGNSLTRERMSMSLSRVVDSLMVRVYHPLSDKVLPSVLASMPVPSALGELVSFTGGELRSATYGWLGGSPEAHELVIEGYVPADTSALDAKMRELGGTEQVSDEDPASRELEWTYDGWRVHVVLAPQSRELAARGGQSVFTLMLQR